MFFVRHPPADPHNFSSLENQQDWSLAVLDPLSDNNITTLEKKLKLRNNYLPLPRLLLYHMCVLVEIIGERLIVGISGEWGHRPNSEVSSTWFEMDFVYKTLVIGRSSWRIAWAPLWSPLEAPPGY